MLKINFVIKKIIALILLSILLLSSILFLIQGNNLITSSKDNLQPETSSPSITNFSIATLTEAGLDGDPSFDSAKIKVVANVESFNEDVSDYSLEVIDTNNYVIGKSDSGTLTTDGPQSFTITNLKSGTDYGKVRVRVVGTLIVSNEFSLQTLYHVIDGISDSKIDQDTGSTKDSFWIILTTLINDEDSKTDIFKGYNIVVTADYSGKTNKVIFTSSEQTNYKENESVEVNGLLENTTYTNIRVKLLDSRTKEILGNEVTMDGDITTKYTINLRIDNVLIQNSTLEGFDFIMDISNDSELDFGKYKVNLYDENNDLIWISPAKEKTGRKIRFSATGLTKGRVYHNLKFQLVNAINPDEKYSNTLETHIDISPTDSRASIEPDTQKIVKIRKRSFIFSINIVGSNWTTYCSPYKVGVFGNGDYLHPIWTSDAKIIHGNSLLFKVKGLKPGEKLKDVSIALVDINYNKPDPKNPFLIIGDIQIDPLFTPLDITLTVIASLLILLILFVLIKKRVAKRRIHKIIKFQNQELNI